MYNAILKVSGWVKNMVTLRRGGFGNFKKEVTNILVRALKGLSKLITKGPDEGAGQRVENPQTAKDFKQNLKIIIRDSGLGDNFLDDSYLEEVAAKVVQLRNDPKNPLKENGQLMSLAELALYQLVLYCDDSGSMAWETDIDDVDRKSAQAALVRRIAGIATRAAPKEGVHLRFINQNTAYDDLDPAEIEAKMQFVPKGRTPLGENLRRKVLQPLVYDIVESGKRLTRPLLILTITDGYPDTPNTFQDEIRKCGRYLIQNGYQKAAVRFDLSQIGNDQHAASFLESLSHDEEISDVLYVTAGHLDGTFAKLRDNEQKLEEWLLGKLSNPVRTV